MPRKIPRRGRPPSLAVAARKTKKLRHQVEDVIGELDDLEKRLLRLEALLKASREADRERSLKRSQNHRGIRGKGPNVRDVAFQLLSRRKKPMSIQDIAEFVLKSKKGQAGANFTQNLGAALARDPRFTRAGRGLYAVKGRG